MEKEIWKKLSAKEKRYYMKRAVISSRDKYAMIAPFFIFFFIFTVLPVISSILLSFTNFNLLQFPKLVGWDNYIKLFLEDEVFILSIKNTLIFAFITGPLSYFLSLFVAWFVNELSPKARALMTFLFYAPSISGNLFMIWAFIFSGDMYGWANGVLMNIGIIQEPIAWLNDPQYNLTIIMIVQLWMSLGAGFLAFIAGLQGIDKSLYESGAIDGVRNRFQELIYITLPSMGPMLLFGAVMQISSSFAAGRISIALAGNPSTDYSANTVITHIVDFGTLRYEMGYASAIAVVLFAAMVLTNEVIRRYLRRFSD